MSRTPSNTDLVKLLAAKGKQWGEPCQIADAASVCKCSRQKLHAYTTGRRHFPYIEQKLADFFSLSIPDLRATLNLPERNITS